MKRYWILTVCSAFAVFGAVNRPLIATAEEAKQEGVENSGKPWKHKHEHQERFRAAIEKLDLSDEQREKVKAMFEKQREERKQFRKELSEILTEEQRQQLRVQMKEGRQAKQ